MPNLPPFTIFIEWTVTFCIKPLDKPSIRLIPDCKLTRKGNTDCAAIGTGEFAFIGETLLSPQLGGNTAAHPDSHRAGNTGHRGEHPERRSGGGSNGGICHRNAHTAGLHIDDGGSIHHAEGCHPADFDGRYRRETAGSSTLGAKDRGAGDNRLWQITSPLSPVSAATVCAAWQDKWFQNILRCRC